MRRATKLVTVVVVMGLLAAGCSDGGDRAARDGHRAGVWKEVRLRDVRLASALSRFSSCDALLAWIKAEASARVGPYGLGGGIAYERGMLAEGAMADSDQSAAAPTSGYSGTNVQVEGVDEPDIVKTDGRRVLTVANGELKLVDASVDPPVVRDTLKLDAGYGAQLLLSGDRALVVSDNGYAMPLEGIAAADYVGHPGLSGTTITEVDLSGDKLRVVDEVTFEGSHVSARMVDDVVRLVMHSDPYYRLSFKYPALGGPADERRTTAQNRELIANSTIDDWLPHVTRKGGNERRAVDCANAHYPKSFSGFGVLSVLTVDLSEGLAAGVGTANVAAIIAGGETVYASPTHLYVATQQYVDWDKLSESKRRIVERDFGTEVHRFDISDPKRAVYEASGRVAGHLLNQYSMDEHDDVLRVATTKGSQWGATDETSESQVVTLRVADGELRQLGSVGGLGKTETIHSVRFMGDTAYVVTFRQTDPLYTVDLSDPAAPRVVGELKIPGYSAYLHPVADGYILGVGQDANDEGVTKGFQVSLFDVRNLSAPIRVAQTTIPGVHSDAEWDPHAFLWWAATSLSVVPVSTVTHNDYAQAATGFTVDIAKRTITQVGRITHPAITERVDGGRPGAEPYTYVPAIVRSFVIGDHLWTLSDAGLLRSDLTTLAAGPFVAFR